MAQSGHDVSLIATHTHSEVRNDVSIISLGRRGKRFYRMVVSPWKALCIAWRNKADIYHFHDPELMPVMAVMGLLGRTVVYDAHEDLGKSIFGKQWIPQWSHKLVSLAVKGGEAFFCLFYKGIVAATESIARKFPPAKTIILNNYPRLAEFGNESASGDFIPFSARKKQFVSIGVVSEYRGIAQMADAMNLAPDDYSLHIGGKFYPENLETDVAARPGWEKIVYRGFLNRADVVRLLNHSLGGLVIFHPIPNHLEARPNKMLEYMAAGLPVIVSDFPLWRDYITTHQCGFCVDPMDPESIARAMRDIAENQSRAQEMGENGKRAVFERYNWEAAFPALPKLYQRIRRQ